MNRLAFRAILVMMMAMAAAFTAPATADSGHRAEDQCEEWVPCIADPDCCDDELTGGGICNALCPEWAYAICTETHIMCITEPS